MAAIFFVALSCEEIKDPDENKDPEPDKWYVCGNMNGWEAGSATLMEDNGEGIFALEMDLEPNAEFKFVKNRSLNTNLGTTLTTAVAAGQFPLDYGANNLVFQPGGHVTIQLDVNARSVSITGGNDPLWSIVGTVRGATWEKGPGMVSDEELWKATFYYRDGQELKFHNNETGEEIGFGDVNPRNASRGCPADRAGAATHMPYPAYWDVIFDPGAKLLKFAPCKDVNWQYYLNAQGEPAWIDYLMGYVSKAVSGHIKYYEVDGIRTCITETEKYFLNGESYDGHGFFGYMDNPGEGEWFFVWYPESNLIQLPFQDTGLRTGFSFGGYMWVSDEYAYDKFCEETEGLTNWLEAAQAGKYPTGHYEEGGGFVFNVAAYHVNETFILKEVHADDIIGVVQGSDVKDNSIILRSMPSRSGNVPVYITVGKDVSCLKYVIIDGKADDMRIASLASGIIDGSEDTVTIDEFQPTNIPSKRFVKVKANGSKEGDITMVCVGFDQDGQPVKTLYAREYYYPYDNSRTWHSLGNVSYTDGILVDFYDVEAKTWDVELQQCDQDASVYRLIYPYGPGCPFSSLENVKIATDRSYDIEFTVDSKNRVNFYPQETGINWNNDGMLCVSASPGCAVVVGGVFYDESDLGTLHPEGYIDFPESSIEVNFAGQYYRVWQGANKTGKLKITMPVQ